MLPDVTIKVNSLQNKFLYNEMIAKIGDFSLNNLSSEYNNGFIGIFTSMLGSSNSVEDLNIKLDKFNKKIINYVKSINENIESEIEHEMLNKSKTILEIYVEANISTILENIERNFYNSWEEKNIDVYLIQENLLNSGKSNPLMIPIFHDNNNLEMQQILVHELIHRNAAYSTSQSVYSRLESKAKSLGIIGSEVYNRIIHPLFFYASWYEIDHLEERENKIEPFYNKLEFTQSKFFLNTILMLEKTWPEYIQKNISVSEFVNAFLELYVSNMDRKRYKGVIK